METRNGSKMLRPATRQGTAAGRAEGSLNVRAFTVAHEHPTPRDNGTQRACVGEDPDLFHPTDEATLAEARAVCGRCPVLDECRDLGLARKEWGVWGGLLLEGGKVLDKPRMPGRPSNKSLAAQRKHQVRIEQKVAVA